MTNPRPSNDQPTQGLEKPVVVLSERQQPPQGGGGGGVGGVGKFAVRAGMTVMQTLQAMKESAEVCANHLAHPVNIPYQHSQSVYQHNQLIHYINTPSCFIFNSHYQPLPPLPLGACECGAEHRAGVPRGRIGARHTVQRQPRAEGNTDQQRALRGTALAQHRHCHSHRHCHQ